VRVEGNFTDDAPWIHREGVLWHEPSHTDLLFITLNKSEALSSPSTRTRDLALGPSRRGGCRGWGWRFSVCRYPHSARQAWSAHASRRAAATGPPAP
jgi:hypothetical protein